MRTILLILCVAGCGGRARTEQARTEQARPVATSKPARPTPRASCAPSKPPSVDELADDPAMDGGFGHGRSGLGPGGGGTHRACGKTVAKLEMSGPSSPSTDLDPRILQDVVRAHEVELVHCYEREACPRLLPYSVRACFTIDADGSVAAPDADSVNANIRACVVRVLRSFQFPKPVRGAPLEIKYDLTFRTQ